MSSNGGVTWRVLNVNNVNRIFFVDNSNGWAVGNNGLILHTVTGGIPVTLSSFIASYLLENVTLNWSTASETNNYGFEIERSTNKKDWRLVGFKEGNGTTTEEHSYSFIDDLFGVNSYKLYYRLIQIDFNGSFEYSNVIEIDLALSSFSLSQNYPNPFNPKTSIEYRVGSTEYVTLKVYDVLGREVATLVNEVKQPGIYEVEFNP